jgi:hypothetical protein
MLTPNRSSSLKDPGAKVIEDSKVKSDRLTVIARNEYNENDLVFHTTTVSNYFPPANNCIPAQGRTTLRLSVHHCIHFRHAVIKHALRASSNDVPRFVEVSV